MARQGIPLRHRDPRLAAAPHRSPLDPPLSRGASSRAVEADDYAAGSVDDYNLDEDRRVHPAAASGLQGNVPPDARIHEHIRETAAPQGDVDSRSRGEAGDAAD